MSDYVVHRTSGTTGPPKIVAHDPDVLRANARCFAAHMRLYDDTRLLHVMPLHGMAGYLNTFLVPHVFGGTTVLADAFSPRTPYTFWDDVEAHGITHVWLAPRMLEAILHADRADPPAPLTVMVGTDAMDTDVAMAWHHRYGAEVYESYGMTEIGLACANVPGARRMGSVGRPLPGVGVRVNPDGVLEVRTPYLMAGYIRDPKADPEPPAEWFCTGDRARIDDEGYVFIEGRAA